MNYHLVLEDGTILGGIGYGAHSPAYGEVVFTTSMSGYLESITDPSYRGQILVFAFPTIANYPLTKGVMESDRVQVAGVITRDAHSAISDSLGTEFSDFLARSGVPGIDGIDTRTLVKKIREKGAMRGWITTANEGLSFEQDPFERDLIAEAIDKQPKRIVNDSSNFRILFIDCGAKLSLINRMASVANLDLVPYDHDFVSLEEKYDAIFVSNGPGDPSASYLRNLVKFIGSEIGKTKIFGVCLGQQIIALAYGAKTYKMHFGHRGSNHAVTDGSYIKITTHNHGFAVDSDTAERRGLSILERDANDQTPEMITDPGSEVLAVQYHPEASPGPHDTNDFFARLGKELRR